MQRTIFDSHAHYDDSAFDADRDSVLENLPKQGVCTVVNCADSWESCKKTVALTRQYPYIYAALGIHPHNAVQSQWSSFEPWLRQAAHTERCVAIGEIGLDYHYNFSPRDIQRTLFAKQLRFAAEEGFPVVVHDREAHEDTMTLLREYRPKGVLHCFTGSVQLAQQVIDLGMYIGLGGAVTFRNAKRPVSVAGTIPLDRLVLETDCPYMTPEPFRGTRNDSTRILYTAQKIAEIRGLDVEYLLEQTKQNAARLFSIV